jgi:hypothetical protein
MLIGLNGRITMAKLIAEGLHYWLECGGAAGVEIGGVQRGAVVVHRYTCRMARVWPTQWLMRRLDRSSHL